MLSPRQVNRKIGKSVVVPVSNSLTGSPLEVPLPQTPRTGVIGAAMADQVRSVDWEARKLTPAGRLPGTTLDDIVDRVCVLIGVEPKG